MQVSVNIYMVGNALQLFKNQMFRLNLGRAKHIWRVIHLSFPLGEPNRVAETEVRLLEDHKLHFFKTFPRSIGLASELFREVLCVVKQVCHIRD